jgi:quinol monooxygenase YgiN
MNTETQSRTETPAIAAVVTHDVESYDAWRSAFDAHAPARQAAGITETHINRHADQPNRLSVYLAAGDRASLEGFLSSKDLASTMREAGVKGPPHIALVTPVEDLTVKDRALAGAIVKHDVADYATWKVAFDGHAGTRASAGIVGHAVNRSVKNPNTIVVYLQAESQSALEAFTSSADLKQTMQSAGVVGAPEIQLVQGSEWA